MSSPVNPNDAATLVIGAGNFFTGPVGTAMPTDLTAPGSAWTNLGHTSLEDVFSLASDGGDATVLKTLQNRALRTVYSERNDTFKITIMQFDQASLQLYFGQNSTVLTDGSLGVALTPKPTVAAFLAIFVDGDNVFAFYAPKAEIMRDDDFSAGSTEELSSLPIGVKPLAYSGNDWAYAVTPLAAA